MNAKHTSRDCPICGRDQKKILFEQCFSTVLLVQGYNVVVCKNCGFGFADHIPEQEAFDAYYRDLSKFEYEHRDGKESESDEIRLLDVARLLSKLIPDPKARILDLGCSTGRLLAGLREQGFPNVWGLDPSPGCAEGARKLYNVPVFTNTFSGFAKSDEKFDFVIMIGVLEHIRDLHAVLSVLKRITDPTGRIYIDVPDATQFADWPDAPFQEFSTEHINFFSGRSLTNLMQMQGFKCTFSQKAQRSYTETTVIPSVETVFENIGATCSWVRDDETEPRLQQYIRQSQEVDNSIRNVLENTASANRPIIVWGIGTHTQRLLAAGALDGLNICLFVDSNPKYHGEKLRGIPVVSPNELKSRTEPILICSRVFQLEIEKQAREQLKLKNELLRLYDLRESQTVGTR
jgi:SAM-dependent methyltransferase